MEQRHMPEPSDLLFSTPGMVAAFSPEAHVRGMLAFEAALARAEARAGIIPQEAATVIAADCREELFDVAALYGEAAVAGTPAIPLVRMLTARVAHAAHTPSSPSTRRSSPSRICSISAVSIASWLVDGLL